EMKYTYDDLLTIAKGQVALEEKFIRLAKEPLTTHDSRLATHHSALFIDTEMYVMKVWCEFVFGKCHQYILDQIAARKYDLYFLCNVDLPWTLDELREYPDLETRQELFEIYNRIMVSQPVPWVEIKGDSDERFEIAIRAVDILLKD